MEKYLELIKKNTIFVTILFINLKKMSMKKLMMIAALTVATLSANAQQMFVKPMVGATLATLTGDTEGAKMKIGLAAGAEFGYNINDMFAVTAGALVSLQGAKFDDTPYEKDLTTTLTYLNVPVLANVYIAPGLAIKAGVQPGFLLSRKTKGDELISSGTWVSSELTSTDGMKKIDLSIPLGLSYEFSDFVIDARYNLGLTNINDSDHHKVKNGVIMLTLGYKIPF